MPAPLSPLLGCQLVKHCLHPREPRPPRRCSRADDRALGLLPLGLFVLVVPWLANSVLRFLLLLPLVHVVEGVEVRVHLHDPLGVDRSNKVHVRPGGEDDVVVDDILQGEPNPLQPALRMYVCEEAGGHTLKGANETIPFPPAAIEHGIAPVRFHPEERMVCMLVARLDLFHGRVHDLHASKVERESTAESLLDRSLDVLAPPWWFPHGHPLADCAQLILDIGCLVQVPVLQVMEERPGLALSSLFPRVEDVEKGEMIAVEEEEL
mmetsp:Transcript_42075/g.132588  ORF Transcript_42075/g.132588 Transcript_42075/m.132588 type:complete len:265 (+) Transcript_42075:44-838(+)